MLAIRDRDLVDAKDCGSRLLLKDVAVARQSIQDFFKLYESIRDMVVIYEGEVYLMEDICVPTDGVPPCQVPTAPYRCVWMVVS